jgi:hypothetical protein
MICIIRVEVSKAKILTIFIDLIELIRYYIGDFMKKYLSVLAVLVVVAASGAGYYLYMQNVALKNKVAQLESDPKNVAQQEVKNTVEMVSKVVALPEGEDPVVATVTDKEKLKDQAFFAKAENGDKVLIYGKAKRIYLFRPSESKLLEAAPLNIGTQQPTASTKPKTDAAPETSSN